MEQEVMTEEQQAAYEQPQPAQRIRGDWKALVDKVSYGGIVNNIPFLAFVVLLCVLYITNNQRTIDIQRELNRKNEELKELRWRYMDVKSRLMNAGMETEVIKTASVIGLKPTMMPPYKVKLDSAKK